MKRYLLFIITGIALIVSGCNGEKGGGSKGFDIVGTWELMNIDITKAAQLGNETIQVTITFNSDKSFELSQVLGSGRPREYSGTWNLTDNILTGKYSDGKKWGSSYEVSGDGSNLTMKPDSGSELYVYRKTN